MLGNFSWFFVICWLVSKSTFSKHFFFAMPSVSNSLDPDQAQHFVGPDLGPKYLQMLSAEDTRIAIFIPWSHCWIWIKLYHKEQLTYLNVYIIFQLVNSSKHRFSKNIIPLKACTIFWVVLVNNPSLIDCWSNACKTLNVSKSQQQSSALLSAEIFRSLHE